jgi:UDP-N-acetylglucosamine 2-epimerase (non-hydrolysing)
MPDVLLTLGTRPELTKTAPFLLEMKRQGMDFSFIFTGQHYDYNMSKVFMEEFKVPEPDEFLGIGKMNEFDQFGTGFGKIARAIAKYKPKLVVVNGDTNSTLMSALAAAKSKTPVAHIEAGCRSFDFTMTEEINRITTDRLCQLLFASSPYCADNLLAEGFDRKKIFMLGNTAVDGFNMMAPKARKADKAGELGLEKGGYVLVTLHRKENVDSRKNLKELLSALSKLDSTVVFPLHPRTRKMVKEFGFEKFLRAENVMAIEPVGYADFLSLLLDCNYAITDSGGVMEEAVMAEKRVIVPRMNVEWYEIFESGAGILCPAEEKRIISASRRIKSAKGKVPLVYPDMKASRRIAQMIKKKLQEGFELGMDFSKRGRPVPALDLGKGAQLMFGKDGRLVNDRNRAVHRTTVIEVRCGGA